MDDKKLMEATGSMIEILMELLDDIENGLPVSEARKDLLKFKHLVPGLIKDMGS